MSQFIDSTSRLPQYLYKAAQVRELDRQAVARSGKPGFALMKAAAVAAFELLQSLWPDRKQLIIFVGGGNNGGDGYVVAGLAKRAGWNVQIVSLVPQEKLRNEAQQAAHWCLEQELTPVQSLSELASTGETRAVVIDALLGTGLTRDVSTPFVEAIDWINRSPHPVFSLDVPSGICSDSGAVLGHAVRADVTLVFVAMKQGLLTHQAVDYCGDVHFDDLDIDTAIVDSESLPQHSCQRIDIHSERAALRPRPRSSHKGSNGHTLIIGGDFNTGGAALLAAEAALRSGSGLVTVVTRSANRTAFLARRPELMVIGTEDCSLPMGEQRAPEKLLAQRTESMIRETLDKATCIVLGPGLGMSAWSKRLFQLVLQYTVDKGKLVLDADGLNLLADKVASGAGSLSVRRNNWILTPHPGEAGRLLAKTTDDIQRDRFNSVAEMQSRFGGVCLLKGAGSLVCTSIDGKQHLALCSEGNPGMATAGMGDVLSGLVASLVSQGHGLFTSLKMAVTIHGEAADLACATMGGDSICRGLVATDLYPYIRELVNVSG